MLLTVMEGWPSFTHIPLWWGNPAHHIAHDHTPLTPLIPSYPTTPCHPQDASTASLVWTLALMADHPEVLARVRAEQADARPDLSATLTAESLAKMPYTRQVRGGALQMQAHVQRGMCWR